jgi:hypothetical protein
MSTAELRWSIWRMYVIAVALQDPEYMRVVERLAKAADEVAWFESVKMEFDATRLN